MVTKDLQAYANGNWNTHMASITEISKSDNSQCSLVDSDMLIYNFDDICKSMFPADQNPSSVDGILISKKNDIELIEFKSGFKQKITRGTYIPQKGICKKNGNIHCDDYWDLFFENQDRKKAELTASIRSKAIESYITLEKRIFPGCPEIINHKSIKIELIVVIDGDGVESMQDILTELSNQDKDLENCFKSIRQSLKRFNLQPDANGFSYYYDNIEVMSPDEFVAYLPGNVS